MDASPERRRWERENGPKEMIIDKNGTQKLCLPLLGE
jgi:hypothetical protein